MGGKTTTYGYNQDLKRVETFISTGLTIGANYQSTHWNGALSFNALSGQSSELGRLYGYDTMGRLGSEVRGDSTVTATATMFSYDYDDAGRLTKRYEWTTTPSECTLGIWEGTICTPDQGSPVDSLVYDWDAVGNPEHLGAVLDSANLLVEFDGFVMTYDDDHNLLSKIADGDTTTFTWNSLGQLTEVTKNGTTTAYTYDGLGPRIRVAVAGGTATDYVWDGDDIAFEVDSTGSAEAYYAYYPGMDRPHSMYRDGSNYHYVTDRRGNVTGLLQGGSTRANTYRYGAFGLADLASETVANALRWGAAQHDEDASLYYMRARYYDPDLQRFVSEDPLGLASGIHLSRFGGDDPVNNRDPTGLHHCDPDNPGQILYEVPPKEDHPCLFHLDPVVGGPERPDAGRGEPGGFGFFGPYLGRRYTATGGGRRFRKGWGGRAIFGKPGLFGYEKFGLKIDVSYIEGQFCVAAGGSYFTDKWGDIAGFGAAGGAFWTTSPRQPIGFSTPLGLEVVTVGGLPRPLPPIGGSISHAIVNETSTVIAGIGFGLAVGAVPKGGQFRVP